MITTQEASTHSVLGGFEIPVGFLEGTQDPEQKRLKWTAFDRQIRSKVLAADIEEEEDE